MKTQTSLIAAVLLAACSMTEMPEAPEGARLFADNCAACHGADATGAGPETLGIGKVPPDLTQIAARNHLLEGRPTKAVAVYRELFQKHDKSTLYGLELADAMVAATAWVAAREAVSRASSNSLSNSAIRF